MGVRGGWGTRAGRRTSAGPFSLRSRPGPSVPMGLREGSHGLDHSGPCLPAVAARATGPAGWSLPSLVTMSRLSKRKGQRRKNLLNVPRQETERQGSGWPETPARLAWEDLPETQARIAQESRPDCPGKMAADIPH